MQVLPLERRLHPLLRVPVRLLNAIAYGLDLDVDQVFLQSKLDEEVFRRLSKGYGSLSSKMVRLTIVWMD